MTAHVVSILKGNDFVLYFLRMIYMFFCICIAGIIAIYVPFRYHSSGLYNLNSTTVFNDSLMKNSFRKSQQHLILFWTSDQENGTAEMRYSRNSSCILTRDRSKFLEAAAVVFNMRKFSWTDVPPKRLSHQYYVFAMRESPSMILLKDLLQEQMNFFNLTMTYRLDSNAPYPYGYMAPSNASMSQNIRKLKQIVAEKSQPVAWFSSNCKTPSNRESFAAELAKHIKIDHYGRCGKLKCPRGTEANENECWAMVEAKYFFYLSFENSICKDYVTEKFWKPSQKFIVPIVLKRSIVESIGVPNRSFIAVDDFPNANSLADYLKFLIANPNEYLKYFEWKNHYKIRWGNSQLRTCELCRIVAAGKSKTIRNICAWWNTEAKCERLS